MTIKGSIVGGICGLAVASPFRGPAERLLVGIGHRFPTSRTVQSFSRHFGKRIMDREGEDFERIVTFASGGKMRCGANGQIGWYCLMHYFLGTITGQIEDERPLVYFLDRVLREGDVFFDVGTNLGFYSSYVAPICGKSGSVHAFEANPSLIPHLERSLDLNDAKCKINLNPVAVGSESNKMLRLYDPDRIGNSSFYAHGWLDKQSWVDVPVVALDDYVQAQNIERIDVMKIDIEGAEFDAMCGMEKTFKSKPPNVILCELMPGTVPDRADGAARPGEIAEFLGSRGYVLCYVGEADGLLAVAEQSIGEIERETHIVNVAFVQSSFLVERPEILAPSGRTPAVASEQHGHLD